MGLTEKAAFLKGLIEGSDLNLDAKQKKIFDALVELVDDLAATVAVIDEDLSAVYEDVDELYAIVDDLDEDIDALYDDDCDCGCEDECLYDVTCEKCGETICIDEDTLLEGEIKCPACGETLEFDLDCDCDCEGDCDCDCEDDCDCGTGCDCGGCDED